MSGEFHKGEGLHFSLDIEAIWKTVTENIPDAEEKVDKYSKTKKDNQ